MVKTYRPKSWKEALDIRANEEVIPIAGGTDLMVKYKAPTGVPPKFNKPLLFLSGIKELKLVYEDESFVYIGAGCTLNSLLKEELVPYDLKVAIENMASPGIRNIATIGGNIINASPAGDTLPSLYARSALCILENIESEDQIPIYNLIKGPGKTVLGDYEILKAIAIPKTFYKKVFYRKLGTRRAMSLSKLSILILHGSEHPVMVDTRIAIGAVAPTVVHSLDNEKFIFKNRKWLGKVLPDIINRYKALINPITDQRSTAEYRKRTALRLLEYYLGEIAHEYEK
ncbi:MAG: FAD binding domain-containing protein [Candidatus Zixiibacteriota bacterium]